jgi:hypothetical protein
VRRRLLAVVAVVAALAVGRLVTDRLDLEDKEDPPFYREAAIGQVAHLAYGDVEVTDARPAQYLAPQLSDELARIAGGVFVLVSTKVTATREPTQFLTARLVDRDGLEYQPSRKSTCEQFAQSDTGLASYTLLCFDVPTAALAGLRFQTGRGSQIDDSTRGDEMADIDLGISAADADEWAATDAVYLVESASRVPFELETVNLTEGP